MPPNDPARLLLRQALIEASATTVESNTNSGDPDVASAIDLFDLAALRAKLPKQNSAGDDADLEIGDARSPPLVSEDLRA